MWVAIIALLSTVISPIIQGRINKNSPVNKADAAERFTRIAAGVAEDYDELRDELRELKPLLQELIRLLDQSQCVENEHSHRIRTVVDKLREKMY